MKEEEGAGFPSDDAAGGSVGFRAATREAMELVFVIHRAYRMAPAKPAKSDEDLFAQEPRACWAAARQACGADPFDEDAVEALGRLLTAKEVDRQLRDDTLKVLELAACEWHLAQHRPGKAEGLVPGLVAALGDVELLPKQRARAAFTLGCMGPLTTPELVDSEVKQLTTALREGETDELRREAARALSRIGPGALQSVESLKDAKRDKDRRVRVYSARGLLELGAGDQGEVLGTILESEKSSRWRDKKRGKVREEVARVLGILGPRVDREGRAEPLLRRLEDDPAESVRRQALLALHRIGCRECSRCPDCGWSIPDLSKKLQSQKPEERIRAAFGLAEVGPAAREVFPELFLALPALYAGGDGELRVALATALAKVVPDENVVREQLRSWRDVLLLTASRRTVTVRPSSDSHVPDQLPEPEPTVGEAETLSEWDDLDEARMAHAERQPFLHHLQAHLDKFAQRKFPDYLSARREIRRISGFTRDATVRLLYDGNPVNLNAYPAPPPGEKRRKGKRKDRLTYFQARKADKLRECLFNKPYPPQLIAKVNI